MFCADAVADPLTGLTAASACLEALSRGGRWLLDVSMAGVSAGLAGPTLTVPRELPVADRGRACRSERPEPSGPTPRWCWQSLTCTCDKRGQRSGHG